MRIARLSRELGCGDFVKVEVIRDSRYLLPDNQETIKTTEILAKEGFVVMPYMYPDLNAARDLVDAGAFARKNSSRSLSMRSIFRSSWMPGSANRLRPVKLWKWGLPQSWRIQPSQRLAILKKWQEHSERLLKRDAVRTLPVPGAYWKKAPAHLPL